jgi:hypothetical protein
LTLPNIKNNLILKIHFYKKTTFQKKNSMKLLNYFSGIKKKQVNFFFFVLDPKISFLFVFFIMVIAIDETLHRVQ